MSLPIVTGLNVDEIIDNVFDKYTKVRATWNCDGSRGVVVSMSYNDGEEVYEEVGTFKTKYAEIENVPIGIPVTIRVTPLNNNTGYAESTNTFYAEENAIYESNCYEYDVFANHILQEKAGYKQPYSLWMQEPQTVSMTFVD